MFDILRRKNDMTWKLCQLIEYQIQNTFIEKSCGKMLNQNIVPDPLFHKLQKIWTSREQKDEIKHFS